MAYKKYTKKDFLQIVENDRDLNLKQFKKMKLSELQNFFNFTHKDEKQGKELDVRNLVGINCLGCGEMLTPDYRNPKNINCCGNC